MPNVRSSIAVPRELVVPVALPHMGPGVVLRTSVPETSIDKDHDFRPLNHDIRSAWQHEGVQSIADAHPRECPSDRELRTSIHGADSGH